MKTSHGHDYEENQLSLSVQAGRFGKAVCLLNLKNKTLYFYSIFMFLFKKFNSAKNFLETFL